MSKWTPEQIVAEVARLEKNRSMLVGTVNQMIESLEVQRNTINERHQEKLDAVRKLCPHEDDGGFMYFRCKHCNLFDP